MTAPKIWFVTGAARGFGRLWTEAALERGDKVAAAARNVAALDELVRKHGDAILPLKLDVTDRAGVFAAVERAHDHFGRLDVVATVAGYGFTGAIEEAGIEDVRANIETNFFGTLSVVQAAAPLLRAQGAGHIVTVSSLAGLVALPTAGIYEASKFAVEGLSEALAAEMAGFGVKVTIIEPGPYLTDFSSEQSLTSASPIAAYDEVRAQLAAVFTPDVMGDPAATAQAIFKVVDSDQPPLRLILGAMGPLVRQVYEERLKTWEAWQDVSLSAQR
jgi:NAD(P)-dependent dehydrogenase (short-subunit alcohol dehydrogenase family)